MIHDGIFIINDFLSPENCDRIRNKIDKYAINDETEIYPKTNVKSKYVEALKHPDFKLECEHITNRLNELRNMMFKKHGIKSDYINNIQLRKIYGPTRYHRDGTACIKENGEPGHRVFGVIVVLNDDYEGGELHFPSQGRMIRLNKGQVIIFPPFWTHPHGALALKNGTFRYTINTWLCNEL